MTTFERVQKLLAEGLTCRPEKITMESDLVRDLGADSLDMVEMTVGFEDEFGITVEDEEAATMKTVGDIVRMIEKHQNA